MPVPAPVASQGRGAPSHSAPHALRLQIKLDAPIKKVSKKNSVSIEELEEDNDSDKERETGAPTPASELPPTGESPRKKTE